MSEDDPYDLDSGPDPAAFAAAAPEPSIDGIDGSGEDAEGSAVADAPVYAVGIGPGNPEYLTPRGRRAIREADVVVGFETVVDFVADETDADLLTCGYADEAEALSEFGRRVAAGERGTAVLMGDPNHSGYQFLGKVQRAVERPVRVIPGISSLQIAASRARTPMEDTRFVTLHKSGSLDADLDRLAGAVGERHLLVLPRPFDWMPGDIAEFLVDSGADESLDALVLERLTHDDERITRTTLGDLRESAGGSGPDSTPYSDLSVLAVRAPVDATD
ncbi:cobalt-precorrin-7 (C(5))-methyltransferase [Haloferax gibbonsii]|uniref:Cobalt-precorrin-6Y C(5)-methyltransferase n=1 Tax=Haloferax gibbonsii TaxID=35746 RepID=A0A0K1IXK3_HALGI|nr:cobalt-precorrin-7 (C(5))-methyltransferase [Haloferax gibbonsii]AKU09247.1 cobalt-precorrin-6Y C(5)-methyltransferase [Haloferax gibbonsii]